MDLSLVQLDLRQRRTRGDHVSHVGMAHHLLAIGGWQRSVVAERPIEQIAELDAADLMARRVQGSEIVGDRRQGDGTGDQSGKENREERHYWPPAVVG